MGSLLFTLLSFLLALAILIAVHEFGHFWVARKLGVKVLRFSIGFGRTLWRWQGKRDETEYVVAAIPLGGYVKMLDEREAPVPEAELDRAFNRQSLAVRSAIVVAGPLFNFLFAIFAFWLIFVSGDIGLKPLVGSVEAESLAAQAGFEVNDQILAVDGEETLTWESVVYALLAQSIEHQRLAVTTEDESGRQRVRWLETKNLHQMAEDGQLLLRLGLAPKRPHLPAVIGALLPGEPAEQSGLQVADRLLSVDGEPLASWSAWVKYVRAHPALPMQVEVERGDERFFVELTPAKIESEGKPIGRIGASVQVPEGLMDEFQVEVSYPPVEALGKALQKSWDLSSLMLKMLGKMLIGEVSVKNLSGPISIAESAGKSASYGLVYFLKFLAVVSISLGVLNLLPVPVLDGGHLLFFLLEAVKGRPLSERFVEQGQKIGMLLLLALMGLAFYVDINRLLG
ncbi:RIP metalloprotease RseP [Candidatus Endoriftia persephone]|jgi:regulator of sigma E protease|uniref:Zinc metalloprotease n=3 Tax=Gammaproteobacteria TaxID=1236 RepID=G2FI67_9GAMM|nr:RIP metalloprotease RseP [Candidatus Endoriftia persephone]EGV52396.1 putative zinc metalloprotease [endosymbiont of Riftia pachyptila (vent Ph05)]EGW53494.1 putative zinc metalloprotease [endosymbiont of Tevnia jerichonana (vent Tica)]USF88565.1 RIP metalloprotease RseP [Candidatus Endoriftia persephone]